MTPVVFVNVEGVVADWVKATSAGAAVLYASTKYHVHIGGIPKGAPRPSIVIRRVGGSPSVSDVPIDEPRISFECWADTQSAAANLAGVLVSELQSLVLNGGYIQNNTRLKSAEVLSWLWLPDPGTGSVPRYVVDARFTILST